MPQDPRSYSPTTPEANRARQQGAGMGQRDLFEQRDPNQSADRVGGEERTIGDTEDDEGSAAFDGTADDTDPRFVGVPSGVDPAAIEDDLVSRIDKDHSQGPKTRSRSKQIVSGKPYG